MGEVSPGVQAGEKSGAPRSTPARGAGPVRQDQCVSKLSRIMSAGWQTGASSSGTLTAAGHSGWPTKWGGPLRPAVIAGRRGSTGRRGPRRSKAPAGTTACRRGWGRTGSDNTC